MDMHMFTPVYLSLSLSLSLSLYIYIYIYIYVGGQTAMPPWPAGWFFSNWGPLILMVGRARGPIFEKEVGQRHGFVIVFFSTK